MARLTRLSLVDEVHFVRLRAVEDISLFPSLEDIESLFQIFSRVEQTSRMEIAGYSLMSDQLCLLAIPRQDARSLSTGIQTISRLYCHHFNNAYGRTETIWHGRFSSCVIEGGLLSLQALIFLESLPHSQGLGEPEVFPWSSYHHHVGHRNDGFVFSIPAYWELGNTPFERQKVYRQLFDQGIDEDLGKKIDSCVKRGWPLGSQKFLEGIKVEEGRIHALRNPGRPKKNLI